MSPAATPNTASWNQPGNLSAGGADPGIAAWLGGPILTMAFYQVLPHLPFDQPLLFRCFRGHWTQYVEMGCLFTAACLLVQKGLRLIAESRSLEMPLLEATRVDDHASTVERASHLGQHAASLPGVLRRTQLAIRTWNVCQHVLSRGSGKSLEQHLRHLSQTAAAGLRGSYTLVRTIAAAIPLLGLVGALAIAGTILSDPSTAQVESPLVMVAEPLAAAIDPVAAALSLSIILMVGAFVVERAEGRVLSRVDEFADLRLAPWIGAGVETTPFAEAEVRAADKLLDRTEELVNWQAGVWQTALENMRVRWLESAERQQSQFTQALEQGMTATIAGHNDQLAEARGELVQGVRTVAQDLARVVESIQQAGQQQQQRFMAQIGEVWELTHSDLSRARAEQATQSGESIELLARTVQGWHDDLTRASEAMTAQLTELRQQGVVLRDIAAQEAELTRLQATLRDNLQAVRSVGAFEESIHSLNAAVHLLTSRARSHAA